MFYTPSSDYRGFWGKIFWLIFVAFPFAFPLLMMWLVPALCFMLTFVFGTFDPVMLLICFPAVLINGSIILFFAATGGIPGLLLGFALAIASPIFIAWLPWMIYGLTGSMEPSRSNRLRRKQLGILFATLDGEEAGAESHYMHDDQIFARRAQRFLAEHHAGYPVRLYDARGRYLFHSRPKLDVLVNALNYGVARGRDNELFVLLVDLIDLVDDIDLLVRAVRVAVARHHQVVIILPWQEDVPDPPREAPNDEDRIRTRKAQRFGVGGYRALADELARDFVEGYHKAYFKIRREFGRLGVLVVRADQEEPVQMVLDRLDRLRGVGRRQ
jgi:hypothetical protein